MAGCAAGRVKTHMEAHDEILNQGKQKGKKMAARGREAL